VLSYDQDRLLAPSKKKEVESALRLDEPLRLDRLGSMLDAIRVEFADYKLTKASILSLNSLSITTSVDHADMKIYYRRIAGQWCQLFLSCWEPRAKGRIFMANCVSLNGRQKYAKECERDLRPHYVNQPLSFLNFNFIERISYSCSRTFIASCGYRIANPRN
jgi:hypothetical protein